MSPNKGNLEDVAQTKNEDSPTWYLVAVDLEQGANGEHVGVEKAPNLLPFPKKKGQGLSYACSVILFKCTAFPRAELMAQDCVYRKIYYHRIQEL